MSWLLDTNVISEARKPAPNSQVVAWLDAQDENSLYLSVITIGELERGARRLVDGKKRRALLVWIQAELPARFANRILAVDDSVARAWGELIATSEAAGRRLPTLDTFIAATAKVHQLTVVSRNTADLSATGVPVFDPWTDF